MGQREYNILIRRKYACKYGIQSQFLSKYMYIDKGRCGVSANEKTLHPNNNLKKVNHYRSMYGLQHGALAHTEQQAIKGPKITIIIEK